MQEKTFDKVNDFVKENEMLAEELRGHCGRIRWKRFYDDAASSGETEGRYWHFHLRVVHVNHGIRGAEADRDERMVETVCTEWNIPCQGISL